MSPNPLTWYQTILEKLNPLRYHMEELLNEMESHNQWARAVAKANGSKPVLLREDKIKAAREAQAEAEKVCTTKL
jgi:hypothetical protein